MDPLEFSNVLTKEIHLPPGSYIPGHLTSPITNDDPEFLLKYDRFDCKRHIFLKQEIKELGIKRHIYDTCHPYLCLKKWISTTALENNYNLKELLSCALYSLKIHKTHFCSNSQFERESYNQINNVLDVQEIELFKLIHKIESQYELMKKVEVIKDNLCYKRVNFGELLEFNGIRLDRDIFIFNCPDHKLTLGATDLLLCVLDIWQARFPLLLYWIMSDLNNKYSSSMFDLGMKLIEVFDKLQTKMKEDVFKILASWEALIVGFVVKDNIEDLGFDQLYNTTYLEMSEIFEKHSVNLGVFNDILPPDPRNEEMLRMWIELTGIQKIFGHPCLDVKRSLDKVRLTSTEVVNIDFSILNLAHGIFIRDFCINYRKKNKRWPPMCIMPDSLKPYFSRNERIPKSLRKDLTIWTEITFAKLFDYDYSPDTSELIKDSAAALPMSHWFIPYDHCAFKHLYGKSKPRSKTKPPGTRIIDLFLKGGEHDLEKKIFQLDQGYFDPQDSTAVLCRKEQEMSLDGRSFVKQTHPARLAQTSLEKNIAKSIMRYVPEQTMTEGELSQLKRLTTITHTQNEYNEVLNLDLSKWNTCFRHSTVYKYGKTFDEMFGMKNFYQLNHLWFIKSNVFSNSRLHPPDFDPQNNTPIPGDFYYNNHLGGMEGMRQKLWTIITISIIKLAAHNMSININIICQGDNQVVIIKYKPHQINQKEIIRAQFLKELKNLFFYLNLKLKMCETWFSKRLFEYGKVRYLLGKAISQATKKISRLIPDINDGIKSFMSSLSTINTITESVAKMDFQADSAFFLNQFSILNYLDRRRVFKKDHNRFQVVQYLFHPNDFGGISLSTYFSHSCRGYDDKVCLWASIFNHIKIFYPEFLKYIKSINKFEPLISVNYDRLMEDIFSLNIKSLPSIELKMKELTLEYLKSNQVTNPQVTKLFNNDLSLSKEKLVSVLQTMKPMFLPLAHEILRHSNVGIIMALRNKFSNIQTINKFTQEDTGIDFLQLMQVCDSDVVRILKRRIKVIQSHYADDLFVIEYDCPTRLAEKLRLDHWKIQLIGGTQPFPIHQFYIKEIDSCTDDQLKKSILIQLSSDYARSRRVQFLECGPFDAYLGSATREKVKKPSMDMITKTSYMKSLQQLILLKSWMVRIQAKNLISLIEELIKEKKPLIPEEIEDEEYDQWCALNWGGNIIHRFKSIIERNTAIINHLPTIGTHVRQTTNCLAGTFEGGRDFTIHFQLNFLLNTLRISKFKETLFVTSPQFASTLSCNHCTKEVTEITFDIGSQQFCDIPLLPQIETGIFVKQLPFTKNKLINWVSIHLGRQFGKALDVQFIYSYDSPYTSSAMAPCSAVGSISINDFREVEIEPLIIGMLFSSKVLQNICFNIEVGQLPYFKGQFFSHLATFILHSNQVEKFLGFFSIQGSTHHSVILSNKLAEILCIGTILYIIENKTRVLLLSLVSFFMSDNLQDIMMFSYWALNNLLTKRITRQTFRKFTRRDVQELVIKLCSKYEILVSSPPQINEDECIPMFRKFLTENVVLSNKSNTPKKLVTNNLPTCKPIIISELNRNYYSHLNHCETGNIKIQAIHHIIRPIGSISTAASKIYEIIMVLGIKDDILNNIYCLAEGSGSILYLCNRIWPNARFFYNTLMSPEIDMRMGPDQQYPPALLAKQVLSQCNLSSSRKLISGVTDITEIKFLDKLNMSFSIFPPSLITMDAEAKDYRGSLIFVQSLYECVKDFDCICIWKLFYNESMKPIISELTRDRYFSFYYKPISSHPNNLEVYLILIPKKGYKLQVNNMTTWLNLGGEDLTLNIIGKNQLSSLESLRTYVNYVFQMRDRLYSQLDSSHDWFIQDNFSFVSSTTNHRDIICHNTISDLFKLLKRMHNTEDDPNTFPFYRQRGLATFLEQLVEDLMVIFCALYVKVGKLSLTKYFCFINYLHLNPEWRTIRELESIWIYDNNKSRTFYGNYKSILHRILYESTLKIQRLEIDDDFPLGKRILRGLSKTLVDSGMSNKGWKYPLYFIKKKELTNYH